MKRVHFYISNNNHHWDMIRPVMNSLRERGVHVTLVSLCEFRRMETPVAELYKYKIPYIILANLRVTGSTTSTGKKNIGGNQAPLRNLLRIIIWFLRLKPGLSKANKIRPDFVIVPNDIAYPFDRICRWLTQQSIPFFLQQEGIRFPLPNEHGWLKYGTNGAKAILAWGDESVQYFEKLGIRVPIIAAGNPRFDSLFQGASNESDMVVKKLKSFNILYISNPVDDQGFCSHDEKLKLFTQFLSGMRVLIEQHDIRIFIRLHPREDLISFQRAAKNFPSNNLEWAHDYSLFDYLRSMQLTIILASTVGLESMIVGTPVAVIKLPKYGYVYNYVSSGSAMGIDLDIAFDKHIWSLIYNDHEVWKQRAKVYVRGQIANKGSSTQFIADFLFNQLGGHA